MSAEAQKHVSETFEANPGTKQFNLTKSFEDYAKSKGVSEQGIKLARTELEDRFAKFNKEGMDDRRFRNVRSTIEGMINNEIAKAQSLLLARSEALSGTSLKPAPVQTQQVAYNPEAKPAALDRGIPTGVLNAVPVVRNAAQKRDEAIRAAGA